jgi:hypothetical protein
MPRFYSQFIFDKEKLDSFYTKEGVQTGFFFMMVTLGDRHYI